MKKLIIILVTVFYGYQCLAQISKLRTNTPKGIYSIKGDYYFDHSNYTKAIENYTESVKQSPKDIYSTLRIAEAYHILEKDRLASNWYKKAFSINPDLDDEYILKYIFTLFKSYNYEELNNWLEIYNDRVSENLLSNDSANNLYKDSTILLIKNLKSINSGNSEVSPKWHNNQLFFSTDRKRPRHGHHGDYNIYSATLTPNSQYEALKPLHTTINSDANEGPMAIAEQSGQLFFTRDGQAQNNGESTMEVLFCDIPTSFSDDVVINKLDLKKINNNLGHPAVNSDGTLIIFASKNEENNKGFDLYRSEYNGKKWSKPEAFNNSINTNGDEMYPSLHNDSILYFASNGLEGMGGFDLFKVNILHEQAQVEHLEYPFNTSSDDFGLFFKGESGEGYLSSNRPGGLGSDDLYKVYVQHIQTKNQAEKTIAKGLSNLPIFSIYASNGDVIKLSGNDTQNLEFEFTSGMSYTLLIDNDNYKEETHGVSKNKISKINLPSRNIYTFHVQKLVESIFNQSRSSRLQDFHVNPGDLITFQLIPDTPEFTEFSKTSIKYRNDNESLNIQDTIVFGYIAKETLKLPEIDDGAIIAEVDDLINEDNLIEDKLAETDSALTVLAKLDNIDQNTDSISLLDKSEDLAQLNDPVNDNAVLDDSMTNDVIKDSVNIVIPEEVLAEVIQPSNEDLKIDSTLLVGEAELVAQVDKPIDDNEVLDDIKEDSVSIVTPETLLAENTQTENEIPNTVEVEKNDDVLIETQIMDSSQATSTSNDSKSDSESSKNFQYRVQIAASRSEMSELQLKRIYSGEQVIMHFKEDGYYKYHISKTPSYPAAREVLKESGIQDAFIAVYKGNTKWKLQDAIAFQKNKSEELSLEDDAILLSDTSIEQEEDVNLVTDKELSGGITENPNQLVTTDTGLIAQSQPNEEELKTVSLPLSIDEIKEVTNVVETEDFGLKIKDELAEVVTEDSTQPVATDVDHIAQRQPGEGELETDSLTSTGEEATEVTKVVEAEGIGQQLKDELAEKINKDSTQLVATDIDLTAQRQPNEELETDSLTITGEKAIEVTKVNEAKDIDQKLKDELAEKVTEDSTQLVVTDSVLIAQRQTDEEELETDSLALTDDESKEVTNVIETEDIDQKLKDELAEKVPDDSTQLVVTDSVLIAQRQPDEEEIEVDSISLSDEAFDETTVDDSLEDSTKPINKEERDFIFRVQIAASTSKINDTALKRIYKGSKPINYFEENGYFKYYISETSSYFVTRQILNESGVKNAFMTAHKGDTKWKVQDAVALQYKKPAVRGELAKSDSILKIITVNFEFDKFTLPTSEMLFLKENVINRLKSDKLYYAIVSGYTDIRGSGTYNFGLSQERAFYVRNFIVGEGISSEKVESRYFGESQLLKHCPEDANCDEAIHQANRRVEILLLIPKK